MNRLLVAVAVVSITLAAAACAASDPDVVVAGASRTPVATGLAVAPAATTTVAPVVTTEAPTTVPPTTEAPTTVAPTAPATTVKPTPATAAPISDAGFVAGIRKALPTFAVISDRDILTLARQVCGALGNGTTIAEVGEIIAASTDDADIQVDLAAFAALAIVVFCPQYQP